MKKNEKKEEVAERTKGKKERRLKIGEEARGHGMPFSPAT